MSFVSYPEYCRIIVENTRGPGLIFHVSYKSDSIGILVRYFVEKGYNDELLAGDCDKAFRHSSRVRKTVTDGLTDKINMAYANSALIGSKETMNSMRKLSQKNHRQ